ncbi:MAG: HAD-IIIA family hydrolase [Flavisolibacter sp.]
MNTHPFTEATVKNFYFDAPVADGIPFREAIILAGGLGTRLREAVPGLPKVMAPVNGRPFIAFVIDHLRRQGVNHFVFSLGYQWAVVQNFLQKDYPRLDFSIVIEESPLGTGGAIQKALEKTKTENVVVTNGDTLFRADLKDLFSLHQQKNAECTLALKPMNDFDRYGVVEINAAGQINSFKEKQPYKEGLINGGVLVLNKTGFLDKALPEKFSFEKDYLEHFCGEGKFFGSVQDQYFIDIGIPKDYKKAQSDLEQPAFDLHDVNSEWTLFLDRDGVINDERVGEYVKHWGEFVFSKGVLDAFRTFGEHFRRIFIISNQRGVGKGLMTREALDSIHLEMMREVEIVGTQIDHIYFCTDVDDKSYFRKPNPGMAYLAACDFSDINFSKSVMVGNKPSDMQFGRAAGMHTVFVKTTNPHQEFPHSEIDLSFETLFDFAMALGKKREKK